MDTVIGSRGGKVILTMDFTFCNFMVAFLLDSKDCATVSHVFHRMKRKFEENDMRFGDIIPLILTDYVEFGISQTKELSIPLLLFAKRSRNATPFNFLQERLSL